MVLLYIAVFGSMDLLVCLLVNSVILPNFRNISLVVLYVAVLTLIHAGLFQSKFLLSLEDFVLCGGALIAALIIALGSKISTYKLARSTYYNDDTKQSHSKLHKFFFFKLLYILIFISQVFFLIALGKQVYTNW
ncbi:hypothetical protein [Mucilaginibacter celer]|uniref:Uncharacterized protein n=1 Tax=Mucilaginibacter celer TaxID=2305508 RepID=A0A494VRA4_9SPHI|nr:hypothetical protein [Mucilaginibacter celer]AYL93868.1 hypothetical protein HYN43_000510 [Mucilaginibacter celer]